MTSRRTFIRSAGLLLIASGCGCSLQADRRGTDRLATSTAESGCRVHASEFDKSIRFLPGAQAKNRFDARTTPIFNSSRDPEFDRLLGRRLERMGAHFDLWPSFGYYDDGRMPNAVASPYRRYANTDGTIAFGLSMLARCLSVTAGELAVLTISAHEWGHIFQFANGYIERIERRLPRYAVELHADFLAGHYLSIYHRSAPRASLDVVGRTWESLGTGRFNQPGTHGTAAQRLAAIEEGYFHQRRNDVTRPEIAARAGLSFVQTLV